jgi:ABC-type phosphate transport system substrate-binding protein
MPKSLDSDAEVVAFVAHNPGAIGYISKASPHDGVKVLTVK